MSDKIKIVMIDDEEDLCLSVKTRLEETGGFEVVTTTNPEEAEQVIRKESPAVVLLDVVMPKRQGTDIVAALKKDPQLKSIPIIVVSGKGEMVYDKKKHDFKWIPNSKIVQQRGKLPDARGSGALAEAYHVIDYVPKPFTTDILAGIIQEVVAKTKKQTRSSDGEDSGAPPAG